MSTILSRRSGLILHSAFFIVEHLSKSMIWVTDAMLQPSKCQRYFGNGDRNICRRLCDDTTPSPLSTSRFFAALSKREELFSRNPNVLRERDSRDRPTVTAECCVQLVCPSVTFPFLLAVCFTLLLGLKRTAVFKTRCHPEQAERLEGSLTTSEGR